MWSESYQTGPMEIYVIQVVESQAGSGASWADEFKGTSTSAGPSGWADEFSQHLKQSTFPAAQHSMMSSGAVQATGDWADEFARGVADLKLDEGLEAAWGEATGSRTWADEFQGGEEAVYEVRG